MRTPSVVVPFDVPYPGPRSDADHQGEGVDAMSRWTGGYGRAAIANLIGAENPDWLRFCRGDSGDIVDLP